MSAADVLRQAEELKAATQDTSRSANEAWVSRQALQDVYQKLLVMDLEFALDKKVEQELWNHAFKNQISTLQNQAKDKQNQKRGEIQASLNLFLETASGFYLQLLQELCSTFKLDMPFRKQASCFGIMKEYGPVHMKIKLPKKTSCMYICQHCLVHLGDIARYRQQNDQAQAYYRHAARLVPYNGQPYNQLAILEAAKGNKLSTVFYYVRSIAVKHPFPVAATNLEKLYTKLSTDNHEYRQKLTAADVISIFLQLHAFIHLCIQLTRARSHVDKILTHLPSLISSSSVSSYQLIQLVAVNLYAMFHSRKRLSSSAGSVAEPADENSSRENGDVAGNTRSDNAARLTTTQHASYDKLTFSFTVSLFDVLLQSTPKQDTKMRDCPTLAALKVVFDWLRSEPDLLSDPAFNSFSIWSNVCKVLNVLQLCAGPKETVAEQQKYMKTPLPEDSDLECFLPVNKALSELEFYLSPGVELLSDDLEPRLRCQRLVAAGVWVAKQFPSLNLLNVQRLSSGKLEFTTQLAPAKADGDSLHESRAARQNVAIQAILQKGSDEMTKVKEDKLSKPAASGRSYKASKRETEERAGRPEQLDASVMANPDFANTADRDLRNGHAYNILVTAEAAHSQAAPVFHAHVRHPFPFSAIAGQLPATAFSRPPNASCCPPAVTAPADPVNAYDAGFNRSPYSQQFPGEVLSDRTVQPAATSYQANVDVIRPAAAPFDNFSSLFRVMPPMCAGNSPKFYTSCPPVGFSSPSSSFMSQADSAGFGSQLQSSASNLSSRPWPPPTDVHRPAFGQLSHFQLASNESSVDDFCGVILQNSAVGSDSLSSGSPVSELLDHRNSPTQLPRGTPSMLESVRNTVASSPFCPSPAVDGLQLSRSLPVGVRFNSSYSESSAADAVAVGHHPASWMHYDSMSTASPVSHRSSFQPGSRLSGLDDRTAAGTGFQNMSKSGKSSSSSLFTSSESERQEATSQTVNTYSLFSQSPWPVGLRSQTIDSPNQRSSPFGLSNYDDIANERSVTGSNGGLSHAFNLAGPPGPPSVLSAGPPSGMTASGAASVSWKPVAVTQPASCVSISRGEQSALDVGRLTANMQSLWSSGPSPLEKLLEQQRCQRQSTPR